MPWILGKKGAIDGNTIAQAYDGVNFRNDHDFSSFGRRDYSIVMFHVVSPTYW